MGFHDIYPLGSGFARVGVEAADWRNSQLDERFSCSRFSAGKKPIYLSFSLFFAS